ncbi:hypothetical protein MKX47_12540 [Solibacillus sp. FSL R7-0668]|uniref:hypothetical protein n=1 Tax=Solibacillus sp. FSL R7-0668 TaxID=2921688 RepID=UPI0030F64664
MKKSMRAFGIGVFLTGAVFASYEQLFPDQQAKDTKVLEKQVKQFEQQIEKLNKQLAAQETTETSEAKQQKEENTTNQSPNTDEKTSKDKVASSEASTENITEATIYIYEDVSIYTIGQQAEDLGIVKNGRELELFLAKPEYSRSIQKGAFDLRSDMTIEEIAKTLTGKKLE